MCSVQCPEKLVGPNSKQVEPSGNRRNKMLEFKKDFIEMEASNVETAYICTKYSLLFVKPIELTTTILN